MSTDLAALFDVTHVRNALTRRMGSDRFRSAVKRRLKQLDEVRTDEEAQQAEPTTTPESGSPIADLRRRRLGHTSSSSSGGSTHSVPTALTLEIQRCIDSVREGLPPKPWHSTLQFVSYDLPKTSTEFSAWMQSFISGVEKSAAVRQAIIERNPSMKAHADTDMFLTQVILPFRSYLMAQVIVSVLQLGAKKRTTGAAHDSLSASMKVEDEAEISRLERIVEGEARQHPEYAGRAHAALHAVDMADVDAIEACLPDDVEGLKKLIAARKKQKVCTRYAEYHLLYMTLPEGTDDKEWLLRMKPLAEDGLAHAQVDVGLCCIALGRVEEGRSWLERASRSNCTSAMLELGRYFFGAAMGWTKTQAASLAEEERAVEGNVKLALQWLDAAGDGPQWDGFSSRDKAQAKQMIQAVEHEAKRYRDYRRAKQFLDKRAADRRKWQIPLLALLVVVLAYFASTWFAAIGLGNGGHAIHGNTDPLPLDDTAAFVLPHQAHLR